jgi:predicted transposase/invertase (TIGR01784 family)
MRAEQALKKVSRDQERWARALFREKAAMDYRSGMLSARRAGLTQGRAESQLEIARRLKARGRSAAEIAEDTGLPLETVQNL